MNIAAEAVRAPWAVVKWRYVAVSIVIFFFHSLYTSPVKATERLQIAAIFSITGLAAQHNAPLVKMTKFAVKQINDNGGILGKRLDVIIIDNQSTPIGSAIAAKKAVEKDVLAVIGGHWSSHSLAMAPILQKAGIPMISPASTNPLVTRQGNYIFRVCFTDAFQGRAMAQFARNDLKTERAAVLRNIDEKYSTTLAEYFKDNYISTGGTVVADIGYRGNATDFSEILERVKRVSPEVIYIPGYTRDSGLLIKQARKMGLKGTFLGADAWEEIGALTGPAIDGSYQTAAWHVGVPYEKSDQLKQLYYREFSSNISSSNSPLAYDAVMILKEAITRCGCTDRKKIRDALMSLRQFQGATGHISFDSSGDPNSKEVFVVRYTGSKQVFVKAIEAID